MGPNCELSSGRLMNVAGYNLTVEGGDGEHEAVTSQVRVTFDTFRQAAVTQSFVIRAPDTAALPRLFKLINFHAGLQLLSVHLAENFTDFYVAVRSSGGGQYLDRGQAVARIRGELTSRLGEEVTVGYSVCQERPCENGGRCSSQMKVQQGTTIVEAGDIVLNLAAIHGGLALRVSGQFRGRHVSAEVQPVPEPGAVRGGGRVRAGGLQLQVPVPPAPPRGPVPAGEVQLL